MHIFVHEIGIYIIKIFPTQHLFYIFSTIKMDTDQIRNILRLLSKRFYKSNGVRLGYKVCSCDELSVLNLSKSKECAFIINTDPSTKPGSHWQGIWLTSNNRIRKCYFFDSYGQPPKNDFILDFIKKNSDETTWNNKQLQEYNSTICGEYCCLFISYIIKYNSFLKFYNIFSNNFSNNDKITMKLFCEDFFKECKEKSITQCCQSYNSYQ